MSSGNSVSPREPLGFLERQGIKQWSPWALSEDWVPREHEHDVCLGLIHLVMRKHFKQVLSIIKDYIFVMNHKHTCTHTDLKQIQAYLLGCSHSYPIEFQYALLSRSRSHGILTSPGMSMAPGPGEWAHINVICPVSHRQDNSKSLSQELEDNYPAPEILAIKTLAKHNRTWVRNHIVFKDSWQRPGPNREVGEIESPAK